MHPTNIDNPTQHTTRQLSIKRRLHNAGFTIVELIIVIVVIGILATITIVAFNGINRRATESLIKDGLQTLTKQVESDNVTNGVYAASASTANGGKGLKLSGDLIIDYSSDGAKYCIAVKDASGNISYYKDSANGAIQQGTCPPAVTVPNPIARYTMNGSLGTISGSIPDNTGGGRALTGTLGTRIAGKYGQAFRPSTYPSDGGGSPVAKIHDASLFNTDTVTITAWVNPWMNGNSERFLMGFMTGDGGDSIFCIWQQRSAWYVTPDIIGSFRISGGLNPLTDDTSVLPLNSWSHLAMTFDKTVGSRLYLNGALIASSNTTGSLNGSSDFYLGYYGYGNSNADFDDVRIYDSALSLAQVNLVMASE